MAKLFSLIFLIGLVVFTTAHPFNLDYFASTRIVGGTEIEIEEAPWQVSLQRCSSSDVTECRHICGGSIINEKWILSAAHCVLFGLKIRMRIGSKDNLSGGSMVNIKQIVQHENWNQLSIDFDYALFELSEPLNFTDKVKPIALPSKYETLPDGTLCQLSGWGKTYNDNEPNNYLRQLTHPIMNQNKCANDVKKIKTLTSRMICAGPKGDGKSGCFGDSGGPLSCLAKDGTRKIFGIASWVTARCIGPDNRTIYARVQAARQWIKLVSGV
uniref:trypsin n=1 Tax=Mayetiola destructor TaxID=39758 RepID=Q5IY38_MAYDE|nr:chymotrypsin precursor [Mayetiola destructor]